MMILKIGNRLKLKVSSLKEASKVYQIKRDESGEGMSTFPFGTVGNYHISYNGRVWEGNTLKDMRKNDKKVFLEATKLF